MRRTASENAFWYRILPWIVGLAAVFSASGLLFRMLWFDEVLTVNLLMKLPTRSPTIISFSPCWKRSGIPSSARSPVFHIIISGWSRFSAAAPPSSCWSGK